MERAQDLWAADCCGPEGIVHGDLTPGNVLVSASGPHLHDFENAGVGPVLWDLVRPARGASRFAGRDIRDRDEFFDAYRGAGGAADMSQVQALAPVVDVIGAVWCLAGWALDPARFSQEARNRMETVAAGRASAPTWTAR